MGHYMRKGGRHFEMYIKKKKKNVQNITRRQHSMKRVGAVRVFGNNVLKLDGKESLKVKTSVDRALQVEVVTIYQEHFILYFLHMLLLMASFNTRSFHPQRTDLFLVSLNDVVKARNVLLINMQELYFRLLAML